jgi:O-antigen ligase
MTRIDNTTDETAEPGHILHGLAMALLLATLVGRITLPEMPFRTSPLAGLDTGDGVILAPGHIDLASVTFGAAILLAGVFWLVDEAMRGRLRIRAGSLGVMIAMFSAWSLVSALQGGDRRGALLFWGNQAGLMLAGWLAIQLCCSSKHRAALLAVTAATGVMLAVIGLRQVFIDAPERIADFEARGGEILATRGWTPQTPEAIAFKERLFKAVPLGFFSLANVFASVMIVLTASVVGLLADRWRKVIPDRRATACSRKSSEIHLPTLAATVMTAGAPLCVVALILAVSRGATGASILAGLAAVIVLRFRSRLAAHWRKWALAAVLLGGAGVAAVVGHGLKHDSLIVKTMTFRWYYWTAGAEIAAEEPLWGVGPGGFGAAYTTFRRPAAEESVKTPHNFIVHAAAQYGIVGALLYLGVVGMVLWGLCRPAPRYAEPIATQRHSPAAMIIWIPLIAATCQCLFAGARGQEGAMLIGAIEPAVILAVAMAMVLWWGPRFSLSATDPRRITRVVLACGLVGFVAHNTVSFSFWMPGAAIAFWLGAGAVISLTHPAALDLSRFRWPTICVSAAATLTFIVLLWLPVARRSYATEMTVESLIDHDGRNALAWARRAAQYDRLDPIAAADIARLLHKTGRETDLEQAYQWAIEAIRRCPPDAANHLLAADILWARGTQPAKAIQHHAHAVQRDPQSLNMRIRFAERLISAGMGDRAVEQLQAAESIHNALLPDSIFRLNAEAMNRLKDLKARGAKLGGQ